MIQKFPLLSKYREGAREEVWRSLRAYGHRVWEPSLFPEAWAVCEYACLRIRSNVNRIVTLLSELGYRFGEPNSRDDLIPSQPVIPADEESRLFAHWLQEHIGPIGMMPTAFICLVGDVSLNGVWADGIWRPTDPLMVAFQGRRYDADIRPHLQEEYQEWFDQKVAGERFPLSFSPDRLHKANISGGEPYAVLVPASGIDPVVDLDGEQTTFINYLNDCFSQFGFRCAGELGEPKKIGAMTEKLQRV